MKKSIVKLKALETRPSPQLLDEIIHTFKVKSAQKWFVENLIAAKDGKPVVIRDPLGRVILIHERRFGHLLVSDAKAGGHQFNILKMKCLTLLKPSLERPIEIYRERGKRHSFIYISPWKPSPGTRYIAIADRIHGSLSLMTHIFMGDKKVEKKLEGKKCVSGGECKERKKGSERMRVASPYERHWPRNCLGTPSIPYSSFPG